MTDDELEQLSESLLDSPASRARVLANFLGALESNGIDTELPEYAALAGADISDREAFENTLAASTVVIVIGTGRQGFGADVAQAAPAPAMDAAGTAAKTVVIAIASAGGKAAGQLGRLGTAASTVVIAVASAGGKAAGQLGRLGTAASTVVIAVASAGGKAAGQLGRPGTAASTVVIAVASAGGKAAGQLRGVLNLQSMERMADIPTQLRQIADAIESGQVELGQELNIAFEQVAELEQERNSSSAERYEALDQDATDISIPESE